MTSGPRLPSAFGQDVVEFDLDLFSRPFRHCLSPLLRLSSDIVDCTFDCHSVRLAATQDRIARPFATDPRTACLPSRSLPFRADGTHPGLDGTGPTANSRNLAFHIHLAERRALCGACLCSRQPPVSRPHRQAILHRRPVPRAYTSVPRADSDQASRSSSPPWNCSTGAIALGVALKAFAERSRLRAIAAAAVPAWRPHSYPFTVGSCIIAVASNVANTDLQTSRRTHEYYTLQTPSSTF